jgi:hypothetical protein
VQVPLGRNPNGLDTIHGPNAKNDGTTPRQILNVQLFWRFPWITVEFGYGTSSIRKAISLPFQGVQELPNWVLYAACTLVLMWTAPRQVGLWILKLFRHFCSNPILVGPGTGAIGNFISSSFCSYVEHLNPIPYASCASIWSQCGPGLRVQLEVKLWNSESDWISTLMCTSPFLSSAHLISHLSS